MKKVVPWLALILLLESPSQASAPARYEDSYRETAKFCEFLLSRPPVTGRQMLLDALIEQVEIRRFIEPGELPKSLQATEVLWMLGRLDSLMPKIQLTQIYPRIRNSFPDMPALYKGIVYPYLKKYSDGKLQLGPSELSVILEAYRMYGDASDLDDLAHLMSHLIKPSSKLWLGSFMAHAVMIEISNRFEVLSPPIVRNWQPLHGANLSHAASLLATQGNANRSDFRPHVRLIPEMVRLFVVQALIEAGHMARALEVSSTLIHLRLKPGFQESIHAIALDQIRVVEEEQELFSSRGTSTRARNQKLDQLLNRGTAEWIARQGRDEDWQRLLRLLESSPRHLDLCVAKFSGLRPERGY